MYNGCGYMVVIAVAWLRLHGDRSDVPRDRDRRTNESLCMCIYCPMVAVTRLWLHGCGCMVTEVMFPVIETRANERVRVSGFSFVTQVQNCCTCTQCLAIMSRTYACVLTCCLCVHACLHAICMLFIHACLHATCMLFIHAC